MPVSHTSVREVSEARSESGQTVAVRTSKSLLSGDLAAAIDLIRDEHAATLAALDARLIDLAAHRDALAGQVKDLRAETRRERADTLAAEVERQRTTMEREREWADALAVEVDRLRSAPRFWGRSRL